MQPHGIHRITNTDFCIRTVLHFQIVQFRPADITFRDIHILCHQRQEVFIHVDFQIIVAVDHADYITGCHVKACVPGRTGTGVFFVNNPNAAVPGRPGITDGTAAVGTSVIHQNDLQISVCLLRNGPETAVQIFFYPVYRDNHADQRCFLHK